MPPRGVLRHNDSNASTSTLILNGIDATLLEPILRHSRKLILTIVTDLDITTGVTMLDTIIGLSRLQNRAASTQCFVPPSQDLGYPTADRVGTQWTGSRE